MESGSDNRHTASPVGADALPVSLNAEALLNSVTDAVCVLDQEWRYRYVNGRYAQLVKPLGKSPDDLYGPVVWDLFPELIGTLTLPASAPQAHA